MRHIIFVLMLSMSAPLLADTWTIETMPPDSDRSELVVFRGNSLPLKTTVSPAANIGFNPIFIVDTVAKTERWVLEFVYQGRQLISFRSVTFIVDGTKRKLEPADAPYVYARNLPLLDIGASQERFQVDVDEQFIIQIGSATQTTVEFDAARLIRDAELKRKQAERLQIFHDFSLKKRKFLLGY